MLTSNETANLKLAQKWFVDEIQKSLVESLAGHSAEANHHRRQALKLRRIIAAIEANVRDREDRYDYD
jgi:hypothetical protein